MADTPSSSTLTRLAIEAALQCQWQQAVELNLKLLEEEAENTDCLNRLAKAYFELGNYSSAKKVYQDVLKIDPYNQIAQKNLKKATSFKKNGEVNNATNGHTMTLSPSCFVEEPGITKQVSLIKVAEPQRLMTLSAGQMVFLAPKNRGISVTDGNSHYLGALPDDTSHHILKLIKGGNKYQAFIKSIKPNGLGIIIRETFRSKKFRNQASFLDEFKPLSYSSQHLTLLNSDMEEDTESSSEMDEIVV